MTVDAVEADVCVIGAGFAGLTAARRLAGAGKSVLVLEARDRVGGRTWTEDRAGCPVDRGGAWLAPGHDAAFRLAAEVGVTTYKTYVAGHHLLVGGDKMRRYKGLIPRISPLAVAQIALTQLRLDRMAKRVPVEAPWSAPRAAEWDTMSMAEWLDRHRIRSKVGDDLFQMAARGLFAAEDPHDVSFLHLLFLIRAHHTIEALFSIEGGAQENLVHGGMGAFAERVAADLGGVVRLQSPVRSVVQSGDRVVVDTARLSVTAPFVVVAIPPVLALEIAFDPVLPEERRTLYRHAIAGVETKSVLVYDKPFWRAEGFSGQSAGAGAPCVAVIDTVFARKYFPGKNPLDHRMTFGWPAAPWGPCEIIGVVGHVSHWDRVRPAAIEGAEPLCDVASGGQVVAAGVSRFECDRALGSRHRSVAERREVRCLWNRPR